MEPGVYADSSFIVSLVCKDGNSAEASVCMARMAESLIFTPLHRIECRNTLRNAVARGELTESECRAAFRRIDADLREGLLVHATVKWTDVFRRADELSEKHAATDGQRTIDLLHVAIAMECGAGIFLSYDRRQCSLARVAGLKVNP